MTRRTLAGLLLLVVCVTAVVAEDESVPEGTPLRVYHDEIGGTIYGAILYSFDAVPAPALGTTRPISDLTTQGYATSAALTAATLWDFTPVATLTTPSPATVAETTVPINADSTCNAGQCGFSLPGLDYMSRQDTVGTGTLTQAAFEVEIGATMAQVWLRAGAQFEGSAGGEQRFCYDGDPSRGEVPQWQFQHQDGARFYMEQGDSWTGTLFNCYTNLFTQVCGDPYLFGSNATSGNCGTAQGLFTFDVLTEGSMKVPSGHWLDALVVQQVADFCVHFAGGSCGLNLRTIRQPVILFLVPGLGAMAQINGPEAAADPTNWDQVTETAIKFGLLPPLSVQVDSVSDTSAMISWDPGNQFGFIDRAKVHWDTDSSAGGGTYAFNSDDQAGQVVFGAGSPPTSATISGLTPGQDYYFTVTFLDTFTQPTHCRGGGANQGELCTSNADCPDAGEFCDLPAAPIVNEYESLLFPETVTGNGFTYPQEVTDTTTNPECTPTGEVANVTVDHAGGGDLTFSWDALADGCLDHYVLLGSDSLTFGSFVEVANTGATTSFTGNPSFLDHLVVAIGSGGQQGPVGHFGL